LKFARESIESELKGSREKEEGRFVGIWCEMKKGLRIKLEYGI
jgi:hypothetical protein